MMRLLALITFLAATRLGAQAPLEIIAAYYGGAGGQFADVSAKVRSIARSDGAEIPVSGRFLGGGIGGGANVLRVYYRINSEFQSGEWRDGETAQIGNRAAAVVPAPSSGLRILRAAYGAGNRTIDVTPRIQDKLVNGRLELQVTNANMGSDPAPAVVKDLQISFEYQGRAQTVRIPENDWLYLPEGTPPPGTGLRILRGTYSASGGRPMDVTAILNGLITNDRITLTVGSNTLGVDPGRGDKQLQVIYEFRRRRFDARVGEGRLLNIPGMGAPTTAR